MLTRQHTLTLAQLIEQKDAEGAHRLLSNLSVADKKKGKALIGSLLADMSKRDINAFLSMYSDLLVLDLNFYFNTFATTLSQISSEAGLWENISCMKRIGEHLSDNRPYYCQKVIGIMLEAMALPFEPHTLFEMFSVKDIHMKLRYLIEADTIYSLYMAFRTMVHEDIETEYISKLVNRIISSQDSRINFNVREAAANFITHYFNGVKTSYKFSKTLDPATFSYAEKSFESFLKTILPSSRIDVYLNRK